jgi:hypothetical protein
MPQDLNKSLGQLAKHLFRIGIPRKSHANPAYNTDEEEVHQITKVRVKGVEVVLAHTTVTPTTSPKDLDHLQKTRAYSRATICSSIVLATHRANDKQIAEAHYS